MSFGYRTSNTSAHSASRSPYANTPLASTSTNMSGSYYYGYLPENESSNQSPVMYSSSSAYQRYSTPTSNYPYDTSSDQDSLSSPYCEPSSSKIEHNCIPLSSLTRNDMTRLYLRDVPTSSGNVLACKYEGCCYPAGFMDNDSAIAHVRHMHLARLGQAFACLACGAIFVRKHDATRHARTMNDGKRYECAICNKVYARKDYRNAHQARCHQ